MADRLAVTDLACIRGGRLLFEGLSFAVEPGGATLVRGPNGAGKSSLLRLLAGLGAPAAGTIERPERLGYLAHDATLKPDRTLGQELGWWARLDRCPAERLSAALDAFALGQLTDVPCRMLSSGQRRRAALARVAASGAPLWLLDEPAVGLDARSVGLLESAVAAHRAGGGLVVATTHQPFDLPDTAELAIGAA